MDCDYDQPFCKVDITLVGNRATRRRTAAFRLACETWSKVIRYLSVSVVVINILHAQVTCQKREETDGLSQAVYTGRDMQNASYVRISRM